MIFKKKEKIIFYRWRNGEDLFEEKETVEIALKYARKEFDSERSMSQIVIDTEHKKLYMLTLSGMQIHLDAIELALNIDMIEFERIDTGYFEYGIEYLLELMDNSDEIII